MTGDQFPYGRKTWEFEVAARSPKNTITRYVQLNIENSVVDDYLNKKDKAFEFYVMTAIRQLVDDNGLL